MTETLPEPKSRKETYLAKAAGMDIEELPTPASREELYLNAIAEGGGGGGGTSDFDQLTNRPKYNGAPMTGETNIPESTTYTAGDGIDIVAGVIKATNTGKARELTTNDYNYPTDIPTRVALWLLEPGLYHWGSDISVYGSISYNYTGTPGTALVMRGQSSDSVATILTINASNGRAIYSVNLVNGVPAGTVGGILVTGDIKNNLNSTASNQALSANQGKVLNDKIEGRVITGAGAPTTSTVGTVGMVYEDTTNGKLYICTAVTPGTDPDPDTYTWVEVGAGGGSGITELTSADYNYPENNPLGVALWTLDTGFYSVSANIGVYYNTSDSRASAGVGTTFLVLKNNDSHRTWVVKQDSGNSPSFWVTHNLTGNKITADQALTPDIVQTTGTSTTSVMSQNAVTSMVFADSATQKRVRIGASSLAQGESVAIGDMANSSGTYAVTMGYAAATGRTGAIALGANSLANSVGEMNIGSTDTTYGYNSSNYRLLTGLYDPQSAHDAATKGYCDNAIINGGTSAPTTATVGAVGTMYSYVDTTGATPEPHLMVCTVADTVTPSYTWVDVMGQVASVLNTLNNQGVN